MTFEARLKTWRDWAQFVWLGGVGVADTDEDLRMRVCAAADARVERLRDAIRAHRDVRGDDRCWMDDETLYGVLPEGYAPPSRDSDIELENCKRFIALRHNNPSTLYVSPQREIERLQAIASAQSLAAHALVEQWREEAAVQRREFVELDKQRLTGRAGVADGIAQAKSQDADLLSALLAQAPVTGGALVEQLVNTLNDVLFEDSDKSGEARLITKLRARMALSQAEEWLALLAQAGAPQA